MNDSRGLVEGLAIATEDRVRLRAALEQANHERTGAILEQRETERGLRILERSRSWRLTRPLRSGGAAPPRALSRRMRFGSSCSV